MGLLSVIYVNASHGSINLFWFIKINVLTQGCKYKVGSSYLWGWKSRIRWEHNLWNRRETEWRLVRALTDPRRGQGLGLPPIVCSRVPPRGSTHWPWASVLTGKRNSCDMCQVISPLRLEKNSNSLARLLRSCLIWPLPTSLILSHATLPLTHYISATLTFFLTLQHASSFESQNYWAVSIGQKANQLSSKRKMYIKDSLSEDLKIVFVILV